ncbi:hypothetical protein E3N88_15812 [Mikania micrantha]|uniref:Uncharacterized protein n=1 Tax=Mikania micrantha TaxID=192012 RepID=A0A5N6NX29_9ASTR|nr:hypothetical protein E3N88_15812 [Mikania micrantha]
MHTLTNVVNLSQLFLKQIGSDLWMTVDPRGDFPYTLDLISSHGVLVNNVLSRSSTESEYKALADTVAELTWLEAFLKELHVSMISTPILWRDNIGKKSLKENYEFSLSRQKIKLQQLWWFFFPHLIHDVVTIIVIRYLYRQSGRT